MLKRVALFTVLVVAGLGLGGCMAVQAPVNGVLFTDAKVSYTNAAAAGPKEGRACAQSFLALIGTGDATVGAAAANGGITQITSVHHESKNYLGFYGEYCTVVRGR